MHRRGFLIGAAALAAAPRQARALASNYPRAIANVFVSEGGYSNDIGDPGGPTMFGITIKDARMYGAEFGWVASPTVADMRRMPKPFAEKVYRVKYADIIQFDELPAGLDYTILDYGVNSGVARAGRVLRALLEVPGADWRITDDVLARVRRSDAGRLIRAVNAEREGFLTRLSEQSSRKKFRTGWLKRVGSCGAISLDMAGLRPRGLMYVPPPPPAFAPQRAYALSGINDEIELPETMP